MKITLQSLKKYVIITIGSFCIALSINLFYINNELVDGGISGFAIVVSKLTGLTVGVLVLLMNIPIFIMGAKSFGKKFIICSVYGTVTLSVFIDILSFLPALTSELLIASSLGGFLTGTGLGIVMREGYTTGGIDIIAKLVQKKVKWLSLGKVFLILDFFVIGLATAVFQNVETGFYSALSLAVSTRIIDIITGGIEYSKMFFIITDNENMGKKINYELKRGATKIPAVGAYTEENKNIFLSTVKYNEVYKLKELIGEYDSNAFIVIADVREIHGEGFNKK